MLLAISFSVISVTIFVFSCLLLATTLYFFGDNFTTLKQIKEQQEKAKRLVSAPVPEAPKTKPSFIQLPKNLLPKVAVKKSNTTTPGDPLEHTDSLLTIRQSILTQQQQLSLLLKKTENLGLEKKVETDSLEEQKLYDKIEKLELQLEEKEEALQQLQNRSEVSALMTERMEEAQKEFLLLQSRMNSLEKQAAAANELAMQLEDLKEEMVTVKKELTRKNEKLQQLSSENGRLYKQLCETEDKLQEANLQRQQFMKKVALLEGLNTDFQNVSDTNSKLKNELRRIGELESMLHMITEERNQLLNKR